MNAAVISVGNEIVSGQTPDTNASYVSLGLTQAGFSVTGHTAVADHVESIVSALSSAARDNALIVLTGGLGPTADDLTREALGRFLDVSLVVNESWKDNLASRFASPGQALPDRFLSQATVPEGSVVLANEIGTACGFIAGEPCRVAVLPGVPSEMKRMFDAHLIPVLGTSGGEIVRSRSVNVFGLWESEIDERLRGIIDPSGNPAVGITTQGAVIRIRADVRAPDEARARAALDGIERTVRDLLGPHVFGTDADTLETVTGALLIERNLTLAVAESCTGGLISHKLTDVSGISSCLLMSVVAYSNEAKHAFLGVPRELIEEHGAVSAQVAGAMAAGVRRAAGADVGLSVTGIAGPTGGTECKPVGLVFIGIEGPAGSDVRERRFHGDRQDIKEKTANAALDQVRNALVIGPVP